jgi:hypothetical protein
VICNNTFAAGVFNVRCNGSSLASCSAHVISAMYVSIEILFRNPLGEDFGYEEVLSIYGMLHMGCMASGK